MMTQESIISKFQDGFMVFNGWEAGLLGLEEVQASIHQNSVFRKFRPEYKLILLNLTVNDKNSQ